MRPTFQDFRFGLRLLHSHPGFAIVAVLTLALGISSTTTAFSWVDGVLLHPYPGVADGGRLALLELVSDTAPTGGNALSHPDYLEYRDRMTTLSGLAAHREDVFSVGDARSAQPVMGEVVSGSYFAVLGVKPALGQMISYDDRTGKEGDFPGVVISHRMWRQRFQSDPGVIGKGLRVNHNELAIVAVAPPDFRGTNVALTCDLWVPLTQAAELGVFGRGSISDRGSRNLYLLARLRDGVSREQAGAEARVISRQLETAYRRTNLGFHAVVLPVWASRSGATNLLLRPLGILMAVSVLVLLIACANVANLLLVRAVTRSREMAVRLALGAGRARLVRQLLSETLLLAGAGALAALPMAGWMADALPNLVPRIGVPVAAGANWNPRVLGLTLLLCVVSTLLAGAAPVLLSLRTGLSDTLKEGSRGGGAGVGANRVRALLVVGEVALATVALVAAGLFLRSHHNADNMYPGFDRTNVLLARFYPANTGRTQAEMLQFSQDLARQVREAPGITDVAFSDYAPLGSNAGPYHRIDVDGYAPAANEPMNVSRTFVSPGFFRTLRVPLAEGREFDARDTQDAAPVMIVNRAFTRKYFGGESGIGRTVKVNGKPKTVVGIAADMKHFDIAETPKPHFFLPMAQPVSNTRQLYFYLRHEGDEAGAAAALRRNVASLDPRAGAYHAMPLLEWTRVTLFPQRLASALLTALGLVSLLLASVGLYSVMAYSVSRQTREIGIRMALGARWNNVFSGVLRQGLLLTALGLALGSALAFLLARLVGTMLVGIEATDPLVFSAAALFQLVVAALANFFPARRATQVEPVTALRCE